MTMPAKDANASEMFALLSAVERPHRVVDLPRKKPDGSAYQAAIVPLTQNEMIVAAAEAEKTARKLLKEDLPKRDDSQLGYTDIYNNSAALEVLWRACKKPGELSRPMFGNASEIGRLFTADEVGVLFHSYNTVKAELGPIVSAMTDDEFEAWVIMLARGGSEDPLAFFSWGALRTLVRRMALELHDFKTVNSSAGSPPEPPEPEPVASTA